MPTALLFPGQGSQTDGMRALVERAAPELLELALAEVGCDPFARVDEGTVFAQPAIVCASLAHWRDADEPAAPLLAGHSLGELSALAVGRAIDFADAVRLAAARGRVMQEVALKAPGGMIALLGPAADSRAAAAAAGAVIANDNGPTQLVAAGSSEAIRRTAAEARARGVRAMRLPVAGAFHTPAMEAAVAPFRAALAQVTVSAPAVPVFASSSAAPFASTGEEIRDQLAAAVARPVRWRETLAALQRCGVRRFSEVGPGRALTGLVKRALDGVDCAPLAEVEAAHA